MLLGALLLAAFLLRESRTDHPLVPLRLFRVRSFSVANASALAFSFGVFGLVFLLAQYLQIGMGYTPLEAGIRTLPWTAAPMIFAPIAGMLAPRIGVRPLLAAGLALQAAGLAWQGLIVATDGLVYADLVPGLALAGIGMGLTFAPSATAVLFDMAPDDHGTASSVNATIREIGGALGVAALVAVFTASDGTLTPDGYVAGLQPAALVAAAVVGARRAHGAAVDAARDRTRSAPDGQHDGAPEDHPRGRRRVVRQSVVARRRRPSCTGPRRRRSSPGRPARRPRGPGGRPRAARRPAAPSVRQRVEVEVQRRRQPDAGLLADLGADDALRALQRGGGVGARGVVAEHRVEHVGVLEVTGDAHVGDRDEPEARVLDPGVEHLRDDLLDALG